VIFSGNVSKYWDAWTNDEVRESKHVKMKPSIVRKAHQKAKEAGKTLGK